LLDIAITLQMPRQQLLPPRHRLPKQACTISLSSHADQERGHELASVSQKRLRHGPRSPVSEQRLTHDVAQLDTRVQRQLAGNCNGATIKPRFVRQT
jgi:hypothetical protein